MPPFTLPLAGFLVALATQRSAELALSARHARRLRERGGHEVGRGHFPWLILLHVAWPLALVAEVVSGVSRPGAWWPLWLALFLAAQGLRVAAMRALGVYWTARVWVVPGMERIRRGPYRWLAHPTYVAVALELLAAPLMFGAWRTALLATLANLALLRVRVAVEEAALDRSTREPGAARPESTASS